MFRSNRHLFSSRQPINQRWHRIVRQVIQKLADRVDSLLAGWTASDNNAAPALCDRWRLIYEVRKIVSVNCFLDCSEQDGLLHSRTPEWSRTAYRANVCTLSQTTEGTVPI